MASSSPPKSLSVPLATAMHGSPRSTSSPSHQNQNQMQQRHYQRLLFLLLIGMGGLLLVLHLNPISHQDEHEHKQLLTALHSKDALQSTIVLNSTNQTQEKEESFDSSPYNTHNPHQYSWCPNASCFNSPLCQPCSRRYLFLLATARSGSTTLLRMLNALPNVRLSGENLNTLAKLHDVVYNLKDNVENHAPSILDNGIGVDDGPMMHHPIPSGAYACPIQEWVKVLNPPPERIVRQSMLEHRPSVEEYDQHRILGWKSVRFHLGNWTTVSQAAQFLMENFPCARIILNYRSNIDEQLASISSQFAKSSRTRDELVSFNAFQMALADELGPSRAYLLDMNDWKENVTVLNEVVEWMGFRNCVFEELVHENHHGYQRDNEHEVNLGKECWYPYKKKEPVVKEKEEEY